MFSIRNQFCPNSACTFYQKVLAANVVVHSQHAQRMRCNVCKKTWVSYRSEVRYGLRSDPQKVHLAMIMFRNGFSVRVAARELAVSTSTIQRWKRKFKTFNS